MNITKKQQCFCEHHPLEDCVDGPYLGILPLTTSEQFPQIMNVQKCRGMVCYSLDSIFVWKQNGLDKTVERQDFPKIGGPPSSITGWQLLGHVLLPLKLLLMVLAVRSVIWALMWCSGVCDGWNPLNVSRSQPCWFVLSLSDCPRLFSGLLGGLCLCWFSCLVHSLSLYRWFFVVHVGDGLHRQTDLPMGNCSLCILKLKNIKY